MFQELIERHRTRIAAFAAIVVPLFLLYVHGRSPRKTTVVEYVLMQTTSPVQGAASRMLSGFEDVWKGYVALVDVAEDNERLTEERRVLTREALRAKKLDEDNRRLRRLLGFKRTRRDLRTVAAHVIGQDVSPYSRVVRIAIDVGEADGIEEGAPVLAAEGLVGRIKIVAGGYAEVMLTVDARSSVNVRVSGKDTTGNLEGTGASDTYSARLLYLHKGVPLAVGDTVITSGHDKVFPPGIEVGYVRSLEERQRGLYYELQVAPAVNFSTLQEVLVVTGTADPTDPEPPTSEPAAAPAAEETEEAAP